MRIIGDLATGDLLQVEKTPELGGAKPFNGRFSVPVPEPGSLDVDSNSYILPVDGGDVSSLAMQRLLAQFPMYENLVFNPLLEDTDIDDLDLSLAPAVSAIGGSTARTRAQAGRGTAGPLPSGQAPNMVAVLGQNNTVAPARPGMLITDTIDIAPFTSGSGADEFLVWWKIYQFTTSHDIMSSFGVTAGQNDPAIKSITEIDQEPAGLSVYLSHDDGANWTLVGRQEPTDLVTFNTDVRLAFVNTQGDPFYLASYAILF